MKKDVCRTMTLIKPQYIKLINKRGWIVYLGAIGMIFGGINGCQLNPDVLNPSSSSIAQEKKSSCAFEGSEHTLWWEGAWEMSELKFEQQILNTLSASVHSQSPRLKQHTFQSTKNTPLSYSNQTQSDTAQAKSIQNLNTLSHHISQSLKERFSLRVEPQFAFLKLDGHLYRLATRPLETQNGIKLVGNQLNAFLWCEGSKIVFSFGQLPFPIIKKQL